MPSYLAGRPQEDQKSGKNLSFPILHFPSRIYHPLPPPPPPPPPEDPPPPLPDEDPGAEEEEEMAPAQEFPRLDVKRLISVAMKLAHLYQAGLYALSSPFLASISAN